MAAAKKTGKAKVKPEAEVSPSDLVGIKLFHDGGGRHENFSFTRAYWPAEGERESIAGLIARKLHPVRSPDGENLGSAAKVDLLLPAAAPQEYIDIGHLICRYEATLPTHEPNAFAQVTIRFPGAINLHHPWEMVRAWVASFYADRVPVIMVLHAPHLAGSPNPGHVHCVVLPRRLGPLGWAEMERDIACDVGQREAYRSWTTFSGKGLGMAA
jgi:hypothetical protein